MGDVPVVNIRDSFCRPFLPSLRTAVLDVVEGKVEFVGARVLGAVLAVAREDGLDIKTELPVEREYVVVQYGLSGGRPPRSRLRDRPLPGRRGPGQVR